MRKPIPEEQDTLPCSPDSEMAMLSCYLNSPNLLEGAETKLEPEAFYNINNRLIYEQMLAFPERDGLNLITFTQWLRDRKLLMKVGGAAYLSQIHTDVPHSDGRYYRQILLDKLLLRRIIKSGEGIIRKSYELQGCDELESEIKSETSKINSLFSSEDKEKQWADRIKNIRERWVSCYNGAVPSSMPSPWANYNRELGGVEKGYIVTMGPRKMGKSTFSKQIALHGAISLDVPTAIFNYEMSEEATVYRCVCELEGIDSDYLFRPDVRKPSEVMRKRIISCMDRISSSRLRIYQANGMTADEICSEIRKHKFEFSVVDILQKVRKAHGLEKNATYEREVADNSLRFSGVASEGNGCTVMALSHMNKEGDARHSSAILNDCDLGLEIQSNAILVRYHRNGRSDFEIPVALDGATFRFVDNNVKKIKEDDDSEPF